MNKAYRPCVVAVIRNQLGQVLAGERSDAGGAWQLPQGGIDPGEEPDEALVRELREEIGSDRVRIVQRSAAWIRYDFPEQMSRDIMKKFRGQEQMWYLLEFQSGFTFDLKAADGEFQNLKWMPVKDLIEGIIDWKKAAYIEGFQALGIEK